MASKPIHMESHLCPCHQFRDFKDRDFYIYVSVHRWSISITVQRDATQSSLFIILQVHSTCFKCQPHPSSGVLKTVTTASGNGVATVLQRGQASLVTLEEGSYTITGGCSYSFEYSWWWLWLTLETCRVNFKFMIPCILIQC